MIEWTTQVIDAMGPLVQALFTRLHTDLRRPPTTPHAAGETANAAPTNRRNSKSKPRTC